MSNLYYDAGPPASGRKVLLATTSYDSPDASYTFSIARSREALAAESLQSAYLLLQGNCHVDDARNSVVAEFLKSDCTELVFIDADVSWEPEHLVSLCSYDVDIVGGVYPYRREGGDEKMPLRMIDGVFEISEDGLLEAEGLPTGFLRIKRHVIEKMAESAVHFKGKGKLIPLLFQRDIFEGGRRSGDIQFCMKWREMGGRLYAAANLRLGHCGKSVIRDSVAAWLRRQLGTTLQHVCGAIRRKSTTIDDFHEAFRAIGNPWGTPADMLQIAVGLARSSKGPIVEMGSGLSTVLMAAATQQQVWCVEHDATYAAKLDALAVCAGVKNISVVQCGMRDDWYDIGGDMLPQDIGLALVDGPPRMLGNRMRFFDVIGERCNVIVADDADNETYAAHLREWAEKQSREIMIDGRVAVVLPSSRVA